MKLGDEPGKGEIDPDKDGTVRGEKQRKAYTAPKVVVHGTVQDLTGNVGSKGTDGITGTRVV